MKKLIKYGGEWCTSCKAVSKLLGTLPLEENNIVVEDVDIDSISRLELQKAGVKGVPTLILQDDDGNEIRRVTAALSLGQLKTFLGV